MASKRTKTATQTEIEPAHSDSQSLLAPEDQLSAALALNAQAPAKPPAKSLPLWAWGLAAFGAYKFLSKPARR